MSHQPNTGDRQPLAEFVAESITLHEKKEGSKGRTLEGVVARVDVVNRNNRLYSRKVFERAIERALPFVEQGAFTGELDHPDMSALGSLEKTALLFSRLYLEDELVKFEGRLLDTPAGRTLESLLEGGVKVGMSTRGTGTIKWVKPQQGEEGPSIAVIQDDYEMFGVDAVKMPSNEAGIVRLRESVEARIATQQSHQEKEETVEITTVEELRQEFPELVSELEEAVKTEATEATDAAQARVTELEEELAQAQADLDEVRGQLEESQGAVDQLAALRTALLGEDAEEVEEGADEADVSVAVEALRQEVQTLREGIEAKEQENARLVLEGELRSRFDELVEASDYAALVRDDIDPTEYESIEALEAAVGRIEKIAGRALESTGGASRPTGKGKVVTTEVSEEAGSQLVNSRMLEVAGLSR